MDSEKAWMKLKNGVDYLRVNILICTVETP